MTDTTLDFQTLADEVFGDNAHTMEALQARADALLPQDAILWECDANTFVFSYVSPSAMAVLGYPTEQWIEDPTFWTSKVVHQQDAEDAVNYCVSETQCDRDHAFEYRAIAADGRIVRLRDVVRVVPATDALPKRLRGVMYVVG
ncbi:PAS domain-containing protein [Longimicrobium sp.]|uniref:PAS domain-containing protein n=1 Tax=Longimicrobium sp. TaxID=2029185 RepID=UPI002E37A152|nr:PAS domain-containing protein [Longimicrobium sp.]HEX6040847.1 PAS domain-containing protein [Longimicrobium sp.]